MSPDDRVLERERREGEVGKVVGVGVVGYKRWWGWIEGVGGGR